MQISHDPINPRIPFFGLKNSDHSFTSKLALALFLKVSSSKASNLAAIFNFPLADTIQRRGGAKSPHFSAREADSMGRGAGGG